MRRRYWWVSQDGTRKELMVHWWGPFNLRAVWRWLVGGRYDRPELSLRSIPRFQSECYCPDGSVTDFHASAFGVGVWGSLSRSRVQRPCSCDVVLWTLSPEIHADEIEEFGGLAALAARFPELKVIA